MGNMDYNEATIVHLSPSNENTGNIEVATFEEAFGEHSNFNWKRLGKGVASGGLSEVVGKEARSRRKKRRARRQTRRMTRINNRAARRAARKAARHAGEDTPTPDDDDSTSTPSTSIDDGSAPDSSPQYVQDTSSQDNGSADDGSQDDTSTDADTSDDSDGGSSDDDSSFSGEECGSSFNNEVSEGMPRKPIHPVIKDAARRIVWNQEKMRRLENELGKGGNDAEIQAQIDKCKNRISELSSSFNDFSNANGGRHRNAVRHHVGAAMGMAKRELMARKAAKRRQQNTTAVADNLDPQISNDQISIPPDETAEFAGQNPVNTEKNTNVRTVELTSNASGPMSEIDWKTVGITAGIALGVLGLLKITKVI